MFSDEFKALRVEEQLERLKAAGGSDRSNLPPEVQQALTDADARMMAERSQVREPAVVDHRSDKKAV